jgi:hypothetical protein
MILLALWIGSVFGFSVLFAPFMAVRHIFLAVPAILLLLGEFLATRGSLTTREMVSFTVTAALGVGLAVSDYAYASAYRQSAYDIKATLPSKAMVWQVGHWGWEWYSMAAGMRQYDTVTSTIMDGDFVVVAEAVDRQQLSMQAKQSLFVFQHIQVPAPLVTYLRTMDTEVLGGYYSYRYPDILPWRFSNAPFEFTVYIQPGD